MKKYSIYIVGISFLVVGVTIGWVAASNSMPDSAEKTAHNHNEISQATDGSETWTCSMHPQIRQEEFGICPICEMDLIKLDNSLGNDDPTILQMSEESVKLAQIETLIVGQKKVDKGISSEISVDGTVELDERSLQSQASHISGRLESLAVNFEGQYVSQGQKIGTLFSTDLLAASQELITASKYDSKIEGLQEAAIQKLKNWKISDQKINEILTTKVPIETIDIISENQGYVMSKKVSQGDYVKAGQILYTVGTTSRLWLIFNVFESDLASVSKGSSVKFTTPALPEDEFNAKINYIEPILNSQTRTATIRAEINNRGNRLKPGMLLNGKILVSSNYSSNKENEVSVPNSAILWTGMKSVVYVKLSDEEIPSYQFREITVKSRGAENSIVTDGITIGDEVVVYGAFAVDAAAQLSNKRSMMNRNVSLKTDQKPGEIVSYVASTPVDFKDQLDKVLGSYIIVKDAMVETDALTAKKSIEQFRTSLSSVDMSLLKDEAHLKWMEYLKALESHAEKISQSEDIEVQRKQFDFLSQSMIAAVKSFGTNGNSYFVQYCPMANNNKGADWIALEEGIRNPYFGSKMMKCGSVKLELK